jgi:hypothetical protein
LANPPRARAADEITTKDDARIGFTLRARGVGEGAGAFGEIRSAYRWLLLAVV